MMRFFSTKRRDQQRGFTLIELLVVISIVSLLSTTILATLSNARVKSRDTRRMQDLVQIRNAIELYHGDHGHYPNTGGTWASFDVAAYMGTDIVGPNSPDLATALSPYLRTAPKDPKPVSPDGGIYFYSDGSANNYCILYWRTPENLNNFKPSFIPSARCTAWNAAGQCTAGPSPANSIFYGGGIYALTGC